MSDYSIIIVEDEPLIAEDLNDIVEELGYKCTGVAYDSETALDFFNNRKVDLVLLDITIEGSLSGVDLGKIINEKYKLPFIYVTSHSDRIILDEAKQTLPFGYILKPFTKKEILSAVEMARFRFENEKEKNIPRLEKINSELGIQLTEKEYECLLLICKGASNKEMAETQFVSNNTIKTHLKNLFLKLDVHNRTSAISKVLNL